jgi:hypothetical protein
MKSVTLEYVSEIQYKNLISLAESFSGDSVNIDKFIMWCSENYDIGNSVCLRVLKDLNAIF